MFNLQNFTYNTNTITTLQNQKTGEILFDATVVCEVLEYERNAATVLTKLDEDEKIFVTKDEQKGCTLNVHPLGGFQDKWFVTESGLYSLILGSKKAEAKKFKRWITHEVLPALRKQGSYGKTTDPAALYIKVERLFSTTKKLALTAGKSEIQARLQANEAVKQAYQVDVFQLLNMEPPAEVVPDPRQPYEVVIAIYLNHREKFVVRLPHVPLVLPQDAWGFVDPNKKHLFFLPKILDQELTKLGLNKHQVLAILAAQQQLFCNKGRGYSHAVKINRQTQAFHHLAFPEYQN